MGGSDPILDGFQPPKVRWGRSRPSPSNGDRVLPAFCGASAREDALSYARQRAGYAPTEIQVLDNDWNVIETISPETVRGLI